MKSIYINDSLHRRAKALAAEQGVPLNEFVERLLERALATPSHRKPQEEPRVREAASTYGTTTAQQAVEGNSDDRKLFDELFARGLLIPKEQTAEWVQAMHSQIYQELGFEDMPLAEPPTIEEVQAIFRRERELHPQLPTLSEILRQMREEE